MLRLFFSPHIWKLHYWLGLKEGTFLHVRTNWTLSASANAAIVNWKAKQDNKNEKSLCSFIHYLTQSFVLWIFTNLLQGAQLWDSALRLQEGDGVRATEESKPTQTVNYSVLCTLIGDVQWSMQVYRKDVKKDG